MIKNIPFPYLITGFDWHPAKNHVILIPLEVQNEPHHRKEMCSIQNRF